MKTRIKGLYAVTPETEDTPHLLEIVLQALEGGVRLVQYRNKSNDVILRHAQAEQLHTLCRGFDVPLIINDDLGLAQSVAADGVHLGKNDMSIEAARARAGGQILIGASCYADLELARRAQQRGASYVAFGSFFASSTKPHASAAPLELLEKASKDLALPIVAIGGITFNNARELIERGADALAVVAGLFDAPDVRKKARQLVRLFDDKTFDLP
jgi:thiamine-phosphate pyrophosphorylase